MPRLARYVSLAIVVALTAACDKKPSSANPGDATPSGAAETPQGTNLRYVDAQRLLQKSTFSFKSSGGGQYQEAALEVAATLQLSKAADSIKVDWTVDEIPQLDLKGSMMPKDGGDPKVTIKERGLGAYLISQLGEHDEDASDELPENKKYKADTERVQKEAAAGGKATDEMVALQVLGFVSRVLVLPELPDKSLVVGEPVKVEVEEDQQLGALVIPVEIERVYKLVKVDESGGSRIAEVEIETVASGAKEMGGQVLTMNSEREGTLMFDLDKGMPVSLEATTSTAIEAGPMTFETTIVVKSNWEQPPT